MNRFGLFLPYLLLALVAVVVVISNWPQGAAEPQEAAVMRVMCPPCEMEVDPETALTAEINGRTYYFCGRGCRNSYVKEHESSAAVNAKRIDVVCNMEVNPIWGITSHHEGSVYYFCTRKCRELFDANAESYLAARCVVCAAPLADIETYTATYLGKPYELCSAEHRVKFKEDPAAYFMHSMWGIPTWLYYTSIAIVLVVSFGVFDWLSRRAAPSASLESHDSHVQADGRSAAADRGTYTGGDQIRGEGERLLDPVTAGVPLLLSSGPTGEAHRSSAVAYDAGVPLAARLPVEHAAPLHTGGQAASGTLALPILNLPAGVPLLLSSGPAGDAHRSRAVAHRFDLLSIGLIGAAVRSRPFRFVIQAIVSILFVVIIAAGIFGNQNPSLNIAPLLTWTIWWGLLPVLILFAGKAWCYVCPWDAMAGWTEKLRFWKKIDESLSLGWRWPKVVRNISIATIMFVGLTWIELGFGVTMSPKITAYLAIGMVLLAVISAMLFDKKSFCRYGCLVGRVSGLYAMFGGTEVRARDDGTCEACHTKECIKGSETAYGCPTFLYPGGLRTNTYCIQCMECIQACPHDNLAMNLRPLGADLAIEGKPRSDEAYLALLMLSITGFHGLAMTPVWQELVAAVRTQADLGRVIGFSVAMAAIMLAPIAVYALLIGVSHQLGRRDALKPLTYRDYFIRYAYAVLPIAIFYHIAHTLEHLLMEGPKILALVSDPFGWNWNLFGTAAWSLPPLISLGNLWLVQALLVLIGHVYSLWVAQKTSLHLFGSSRAAFRSQVPMLVGMISFSVFSLWLLKQPMQMHTSAM